MLTRVPKADIRKGMFVEAVECSAAAFGKRRFLLNSHQDYLAIQESPADFVVINTTYGTEAAPHSGQRPLTRAEKRAEAAATLTRSIKALKTELITVVVGGKLNLESLSKVVEEIGQADSETTSLFYDLTRFRQKDEALFQHSLAVGILMGKLGTALELDTDTVALLVLSGLLHDVGKLTLSKNILQKQTPLTAVERKLLRSHPQRGHHLLKRHVIVPDEVLDVCLHHHEALDGGGYPSGKSASEISQMVRIATVCDAFDKLTTARPGKNDRGVAEAIAWMFARDHQFDRKLVLRLGAIIDD
ncbi:HD domain-containing phosphohydrolase [Hoeflea sp.]|uniref:HD-GYP domain-containing protein n=1 Tax=Hoeflea sp. TaxID=1940281 RepID=UPI0025BFF405|nr:HD domain-containing phosphohydrolase [Hoeflea sp.]